MNSLRLRHLTVILLVAAALGLSGCGKVFRGSVPVEVTFRPSWVTKGYVAQFHNVSAKPLQIRLCLESPTLGMKEDRILSLDPYQTQEYGFVQGWRFFSGEKITLTHADYWKRTVRVP